jgi:hypothetical protein
MDEMQAGHPDPACAHRALPDGLLSIEVLQRYAAGANRCLKSVVAQRKPAGAPANP